MNRNDPCPCGSGKKYKKCCMGKPASAAAGGRAGRAGAAGPAAAAPPATLAEALESHQAGRLDAAAAIYARVLERKPKEVRALVGLGQIRGQLGDTAEGIRLLRRAIALDGRRAEYFVSLAALLHLNGDADEALRCAKRAIEINPKAAAAHGIVASCLERRNRYDEAMVAAKRAIALDPRDANTVVVLAGLHRQKKQLSDARRLLEDVCARPSVQGPLRQDALNELGVVLDRMAEYGEAYGAFVACGAETARDPLVQRTDRDVWLRRIANYKRGTTPDLLTRWTAADFGDDHPVPAFLIGFSRSGTTMIEQVLAAHPVIATSNEKPLMRNTKRRLAEMTGGSGEDVPAMLRAIDRERMVELRAFYWEQARLHADTDPTGKIFVHKQPLNMIDVAFINALFPEGRVIIALRDPRDVCLSCFMQSFKINSANVNFLSLDRTVTFYAHVMDLWLHLRGMLTFQHILVRYEDTVRDLETQARRILDLLSLPWDDSVLHFQEKARDRYIATPSYEAVTQPVHTKSIGRWQNYAEHFAPFQEQLRPFVEAFGY